MLTNRQKINKEIPLLNFIVSFHKPQAFFGVKGIVH